MVTGILVLVFAYAVIQVNLRYNASLTLIASGAALVLFASQCAPFASTRPSPYDPLSYLGRLSYEMYLFHMTVFALLSTVIPPSFSQYPALIFALAMLCIVAVSDVVARFYAEPLNRFLRVKLLSMRRPHEVETVPISQSPL